MSGCVVFGLSVLVKVGGGVVVIIGMDGDVGCGVRIVGFGPYPGRYPPLLERVVGEGVVLMRIPVLLIGVPGEIPVRETGVTSNTIVFPSSREVVR